MNRAARLVMTKAMSAMSGRVGVNEGGLGKRKSVRRQEEVAEALELSLRLVAFNDEDCFEWFW